MGWQEWAVGYADGTKGYRLYNLKKEKILSVYTWDGNKPKGPSFYQAEKESKSTRQSQKPFLDSVVSP